MPQKGQASITVSQKVVDKIKERLADTPGISVAEFVTRAVEEKLAVEGQVSNVVCPIMSRGILERCVGERCALWTRGQCGLAFMLISQKEGIKV
jgi:hypothetical protein